MMSGHMKDLLSVKDLIKHGLKLIVRPEKVARVGRRKEGKYRLIVVTLQDESEKWELLKMAKRLRNAGSKYEKYT